MMKMNSPDPYLVLKAQYSVSEMPKHLLPYLETVRRASVWKSLGFSVELNEYGHPSREVCGETTFWVAREKDPIVAEAIRTLKKALRHPLPVFEYFHAGSDFSEFVDLPEDVKAYCLGNHLRITGRLVEALPLLEQAVNLNPAEVRYREVYYPLRLELGDISSVDEEFTCFEQDMDSIIHTGRFEIWIKALIAAESYSHAREMIERIDVAILRLAEGATTARFYGIQKLDWYTYKRQQFLKKAQKFQTRIDTLESRAVRRGLRQ